ncbi:hypothetical protein ACRS7F_26435 [Brucella anthropi]|uniref:hypothetical protein n=1 Tax=Brucella anthropi TaxID=529 RepID=UPI003EE3732D
MATNKGPSKIAFLPELQGSEAMTALIDRVRGLAASNQFPNALSAIDEFWNIEFGSPKVSLPARSTQILRIYLMTPI